MNEFMNDNPEKKYIEVDEEFMIRSEQDAIDIAALCAEKGASSILFRYKNLAPSFFDLKTGLAGEVLQKFMTYKIRVAAIIPSDKITGKFREMVIESNRGNHFKVFETKKEAENWLLKIE